jgi:hypothetical protein
LGPVLSRSRSTSWPASRRPLKMLAELEPCMVANLAADFANRIVASDASPFGEGAIAAHVPRRLAAKLWRHRDRRGAYSRLRSTWSSALRLAELHEDVDDLEPDCWGTSPRPERVLLETFDFVEICGGQRSSLSAAIRKQNLILGPRVDLNVHAMWDLRCLRVMEWSLFLAERGRVWLGIRPYPMAILPPCAPL